MAYLFCYTQALRNSKGLEKAKLNFFLCDITTNAKRFKHYLQFHKIQNRNIITIQLIAYQIWKDGTCASSEAENKRGRDRAVASVVLFQNLMVLGLFKSHCQGFPVFV
ncbi:Hypothetical_protein [Hexamita inflata]|uniref:Hypothetical_protein n=1 Tax=Hexamita inflata TaxID=28002 RepID=A0AA86TYH1_9EUKA|nr:Hypothetical protein HINF_LOCUS20851 [Hexamita inflata]